MNKRADRKEVPLFSLREAASRGVSRIRQSNWAHPMDHIKIDILSNGDMGPWAHIYSPLNQAINGRDPVDMLCITSMGIDPDAKGGYAYAGPLPESEEYKAESERFLAEYKNIGSS
jgi:hypothetical protein